MITALSKNPTDQDYLSDLVFFHEHRNILRDVIHAYTEACIHENHMDRFEQLALYFIHDTEPDGYDAAYQLKTLFESQPKKLDIIKKLLQNKEAMPDCIDF